MRQDLGSQAPRHDPAPSPDVLGCSPSPALRDLQLVELSVLRELLRVCEAHGLRYFLAYGTLLGAVRHRGFIPWDDDIDVTMPRSDYDRLGHICGSGLRPGFRWQSYSTDRDYPHLFGKLVRDGTVLTQEPTAHLPIQHSVYIDVFPLDGCAGGRWSAVTQRVVLRLIRGRLGVSIRRGSFNHAIAQLTRVIPRSMAIAAFERMVRSIPAEGSARWICVGGPYGAVRQTFPSVWFGAGAPQVFEDVAAIGPLEWDKYLNRLYGDYMTPPPVAKRTSHHQVTFVRLKDQPFEEAAP